MKLYAVYLGDGRYAVMGKLVGTWEFGLNPVVLTTDESYMPVICTGSTGIRSTDTIPKAGLS
jgi:hypothetical protein